jgi:hypothetical protein
VCKSTDLSEYLDLGLMPLCNNIEPTQELAKNKARFPLKIMFCNTCGLSQLSVVIDPKELFKHYTYVSGINQGYINHCRKMAKDLKDRFNLTDNSFMIDIASNDGSLLKQFKEEIGLEIIGVDPAANLTEIAIKNGIPSITDFWGLDVIFKIGKRADILTATNVFAHLDNVVEFIVACRGMLHHNAILVIENPYLIDFIDNMEWDTCYHEHVTYWSLLPMIKLCDSYQLKVISAEKQNIHGGTMRYIITRKESDHTPSPDIEKLCEEERSRGFDKFEVYSGWADKVKQHISTFRENILALKKEGNTIIGFAASAKGNTLLNCAGIDDSIIDCIIDETPEKKGKFYPGVGIKIIGIENIMKIKPDYIVILSWNFGKDIIEKVKLLGYTGKFIIPIPSFSILG